MELLLSLGASRMEATSDIIQRAARVALTPILNQMSVVGLVSIPGMMTGQILSGSDPSQVFIRPSASSLWKFEVHFKYQ